MKKLLITAVLMLCIISQTRETPLPKQDITIERPKVDLTQLEGVDTIITDLVHLHPAFRNKVIDLMVLCHKEGIELRISETYRSISRQNYLKAIGRHVTTLVGGDSRHQYGLAIDLIPYRRHKLAWNEATLHRIGTLGESIGLGWGGKWQTLYDPGHFEWKITTEELRGGMLPDIPDTLKILI